MSIREFLLNIATVIGSIASRGPTHFTQASRDALSLGPKSHLQSRIARLKTVKPRSNRWTASDTGTALKRIQMNRSTTAEVRKMKIKMMERKGGLKKMEEEFWDSTHQRLGPWA